MTERAAWTCSGARQALAPATTMMQFLGIVVDKNRCGFLSADRRPAE